ncbi:RNA polymerase sigma factor for flagellar operon [hydrothermal vent metagenome]|uniref:RNA polymerase sigma factor for flagellar operon n=1 Tax=hydrothermal vent metagenome TaxID=652676 RepID=A0A3B0R0I0_9ZZZZ
MYGTTESKYMTGLSKRDHLIVEHASLVKIIAHQLAIHLPPHIDVNDLMGSGSIGLIEAVDKFDPDRGVKFKTYATIRIRGAIMDELRNMDWMSRSMREKSNQLVKAYDIVEKRHGRPAETEEVAEFLGISHDNLFTLLREVSSFSVLNIEDLGLKDGEGMNILDCIKDPNGKDPVTVHKLKELRETIKTAVDHLPDKEKLVVSLYYYDELTMKEIGRVLDITESRVCQLHSQSMHRLKGRLKKVIKGE